MVEPEKPLKKKDQILIDEEIAQRLQEELQAELEEEERLARQKEEDANIVKWDNVQAMTDAGYELAARLQAEEQEELTIEERSKMFVELMDKRKKHFARLRAEKQRRKPPTKAQKRSQMSTYLKHMAGYKQNQLKKQLSIYIYEDLESDRRGVIRGDVTFGREGEEMDDRSEVRCFGEDGHIWTRTGDCSVWQLMVGIEGGQNSFWDVSVSYMETSGVGIVGDSGDAVRTSGDGLVEAVLSVDVEIVG
ncbi:hypothetical protein Tco_1319073 [Tanacetum coccineum]